MATLQKDAGLVARVVHRGTVKELPLVTFHGLRHSFATHAILANQPLKLVSAFLGHANQKVTEEIYIHLLAGSLRQVAEVFAGVAPSRT
jgi:integrase